MQPQRQLHNLIEFANTRLQPQLVAWRQLPLNSTQIVLQLLETHEWLDLGTKLEFFHRDEATKIAIEAFLHS